MNLTGNIHAFISACVQRKVGGLLARTNVYDASCGLSVQLLPSSLLHVFLRCCYYMKSVAKIDKRRTRSTVPDARASLSVSARGLGGTRTLALFMVSEEDLIYDPVHPRPPMALIQSDLWGVLQHLKESDKQREKMKRGEGSGFTVD